MTEIDESLETEKTEIPYLPMEDSIDVVPEKQDLYWSINHGLWNDNNGFWHDLNGRWRDEGGSWYHAPYDTGEHPHIHWFDQITNYILNQIETNVDPKNPLTSLSLRGNTKNMVISIHIN